VQAPLNALTLGKSRTLTSATYSNTGRFIYATFYSTKQLILSTIIFRGHIVFMSTTLHPLLLYYNINKSHPDSEFKKT